MFGAAEFVKQRLPEGVVYSEIIWHSSVVSGANRIVKVDYGKSGAQWILVSGLFIASPAGGATVTFTDAFGITIFQVFQDPSTTGSYEFWFLIKGSTLDIRCDVNTVLFSVGHQYLTKKVNG